MVTPDDHLEIVRLLRQNEELLKENNALLHRMHRLSIYGATLRVIWFAVLIGFPFAVYFYLIEPYFSTFGMNYNSFVENAKNIPGLQGLGYILPPLGE